MQLSLSCGDLQFADGVPEVEGRPTGPPVCPPARPNACLPASLFAWPSAASSSERQKVCHQRAKYRLWELCFFQTLLLSVSHPRKWCVRRKPVRARPGGQGKMSRALRLPILFELRAAVLAYPILDREKCCHHGSCAVMSVVRECLRPFS